MMFPFTQKPLTAKTLRARLARYGFWDRKHLELAVARNALLAAKQVARASPGHMLPQELAGVVPSEHHSSEFLNRMYKFEPLMAHKAQLWQEILLLEPEPPNQFKISALNALTSTLSQDKQMYAVSAVMRSELAKKQFTAGIGLIPLAPLKPWLSVLGLPVLSFCAAAASFATWISAPVIGVGLAVFWAGLGLNGLRLPEYSRVQWTPWSSLGRLAQLRRSNQLKLANALVTGFEELGSVNIANYHRMAGRSVDTRYQDELDLVNALRKYGMEVRSVDKLTEMYADYWSEHNLRWSSVEWLEPDQDPAEIEYENKHKQK